MFFVRSVVAFSSSKIANSASVELAPLKKRKKSAYPALLVINQTFMSIMN